MSHSIRRSILCSLIATLLLLAPISRADDLAAHPGFVQLSELGIYDNEDDLSFEITLHDSLLRLVTVALEDDEPEMAEALGKIRSIRFLLYEVDGDALSGIRRKARSSVSDLTEGGWQKVVQMRDGEAVNYLLLKWDDEIIVGLLAIFSDAGEVGMINITGEIDPEQIGRIGRQFDLDMLETAQESLKNTQAPKDGSKED